MKSFWRKTKWATRNKTHVSKKRNKGNGPVRTEATFIGFNFCQAGALDSWTGEHGIPDIRQKNGFVKGRWRRDDSPPIREPVKMFLGLDETSVRDSTATEPGRATARRIGFSTEIRTAGQIEIGEIDNISQNKPKLSRCRRWKKLRASAIFI
ncbi:MAG: hypothetical protein ACLFN9_22545 [Desulfococcaceae bacterium]